MFFVKQNREEIRKIRRLRSREKLAVLSRELVDPSEFDSYNFETELSSTSSSEGDSNQNSVFILPKPKSKGLIVPSQEEININPRSRSAKLRWATRA